MNVILLFGGVSEEYEISLRSAAAVLGAIPAHHSVFPIAIDREGGWYLTAPDPAAIASDGWQADAEPVLLDPGRHALLVGGRPLPADAVLPILHGGLGEGGGIAALLTLLGLPYVGCPPTAGALGMDKLLTKQAAERCGLRTATYQTVTREMLPDPALPDRLGRALGYPMFVKPTALGSSVGASRVDSPAGLLPALTDALAYGEVALCEEYIEGCEVELALLERGDELLGALVGEIDPGAPFYDYSAKYRDRRSRIFIPARLPKAIREEIASAGRLVFRALGCRGLARVDFFVRGDEVFFNEINTMPGFTEVSMFPRLMAAAGIPLGDVVEILLKSAHL